MNKLVCEVCGGELLKESEMFVCQSCGIRYSRESLQNKIQEITGTVKVDGSVETVHGDAEKERLIKNAETYLRLEKYADARNTFNLVTREYPDDYRGWWGVCKAGDYQDADAFKTALRLADDATGKAIEAQYVEIWKSRPFWEVTAPFCDEKAKQLAKVFNEKLHYSDLPYKHKRELVADLLFEPGSMEIIDETRGSPTFYVFEDIRFQDWSISSLLGHSATIYGWITGDDHSYVNVPLTRNINSVSDIDAFFQEADEYRKENRSGCYIATAVYGSYDCPQVWTLRRFRDKILAKSWYGCVFIHTYYAISPIVVKWFGQTNWFNHFWKTRLDKLVNNLHGKGISDEPYQDRQW